MRLTTYTDYTLRTLMYLAVKGDRPATIAEIAGAYRISEAHMMKVVHQLGAAGDIGTMRGRKGGIRLARPAADINLGAVVRRTENDLQMVPCFDGPGACVIDGPCVLKGALREALAAFFAVLDRYTLADLAAPRRGLGALLGIEAASGPAPIPATATAT